MYRHTLIPIPHKHAKSPQGGRLFTTLWTVACQAPLFMGFSRQELEWVAMPSARGSS